MAHTQALEVTSTGLSRFGDLLNAGCPVAIGWYNFEMETFANMEARFSFPSCNIIAQEQILMASASRNVCYLCGHPTTHRQTSELVYPPLGRFAYICAECDA